MVNFKEAISQKCFGDLVGISQQAVSDLMKRGVLSAGQNGELWLHAYCANLREQAAGRGDHVLSGERASLARVQRERIEMQNAVTRRQFAPVALIETVLADIGQKIAAVLDTIPGDIKRHSKTITAEDVEIVAARIAKVRNIAASVQLDLENYDSLSGDTGSDPERLESA